MENGQLSRAFFDYSTQTNTDISSQFAHLYHHQGEPIIGGEGVYPSDAYYCPNCHHVLGNSLQTLKDAMFICPVCQGERYWP
jgi:hypothetical protein